MEHNTIEVPPFLLKLLKGPYIWPLIAFILIGFFLITTIRVQRISGEEVGLILNKFTGEVEVVDMQGTRVYNAIMNEFYVIDKTLQTLEMSADLKRGDRRRRDDLKVKDLDGNNIYVELKVQYRIIPENIKEVLETSGYLDKSGVALYKSKWAREYVRSICRDFLGELKTEEFYESMSRTTKINLAQKEINTRLAPFGIYVDSIVMFRKPTFHVSYQDIINRKEKADQDIKTQIALAKAATEKRETLLTKENNVKVIELARHNGKLEETILAAKAKAEQVTKNSDAYFDRITIGAEARLYKNEKQAAGIFALKKAEAEGIEALKNALEGEGGLNMVKMEYAKKLKNMKIQGLPYTIKGQTERLQISEEAAASIKTKGKR
ncbi:MAG: SPFH domain-containing protein [Lentisphaeraceae bacterium]|nr:SPFH domain-containing protein [Lentisphaeraceae bacterium]